MITLVHRILVKQVGPPAKDKGFTLIELLVVVLVIGILAAIAIPAFLIQRQGSWETQVRSDLRNASLAAESYAADHNGTFRDMCNGVLPDATSIRNWGFNPTAGVTLDVEGTPSATYVLKATHSTLGSSKVYRFSSETGKIAGPTTT